MRGQEVSNKIATKPLRNSLEIPSTANLIFLRDFQYWAKFLISYKTYVLCVKSGFLNEEGPFCSHF